ncbi:MAG: hypothetical protein LBH34_03115, partial [Prevotellaceae bacterium]|nr:hypothetical protein [Prevotellaceae bacterium]
MKRIQQVFIVVSSLFFFNLESFGQPQLPFSLLTTHTDTANQRIYAEIMYEKPSCQDYQVQFEIGTRIGRYPVKVDSFLNNEGTFTNVGDSILQRPTAGGYKLLFSFPSNVTVADSPYLCLRSKIIPYRCDECAAASSSPLFSPKDITADCPYLGLDMIACRKRRTHNNAQAWEGWIQDTRDCKPYHIIMMPDDRWWYAQNLNYQKDLQYWTLSEGTLGNNGKTGGYWCPNGLTVDNGYNISVATSSTNASVNTSAVSPVMCDVYGALYSWHTAMALNGRTVLSSVGQASYPMPLGTSSTSQGICPEGWVIPSDYDWGYMLNKVERTIGNYLDHILEGNTTGFCGSTDLTSSLRDVGSCPPHASVVDTFCANQVNPFWTWCRKDYSGKISSPYVLGTNKYGFSVRPSGGRDKGNTYFNLGGASYFWSSSESSSSVGFYRSNLYNECWGRHMGEKDYGFSIRCVSLNPSLDVPSTISYAANAFTLNVHRPAADADYIWSVNSKDISDIESKIQFSSNGMTSSYNTTMTTEGITSAEKNKSFNLQLKIAKLYDTIYYNKEITIIENCEFAHDIIIASNNSIGGKIRAKVKVLDGGTYAYAWGENSMTFTNSTEYEESINTSPGTPEQMIKWTLKIRNEDGCESTPIYAYTSFPAIPGNTTFCSGCGYDGNTDTWVDFWVSGIISGNVMSGNCPGAPAYSLNDGRANTKRLSESSVRGSGLNVVLDKGVGWYIPSYGEGVKGAAVFGTTNWAPSTVLSHAGNNWPSRSE